MNFQVEPITIKEANRFVKQYHRHLRPVRGGLFSIAISQNGVLVGVIILGRPISRHRDDGQTIEVTRCCTLPNTANACSKLYGLAWRVAQILGYRRLITYSSMEESGASLRGAGYQFEGLNRGGSWHSPSRPREDHYSSAPKLIWIRKR